MRLENEGLRLGAEGFPFTDPLVDLAWICARGLLLDAHENRTGLVENFSFESCWEQSFQRRFLGAP